MNLPNYLDIERRPLRHWNVDGLPELLVGLLWLIWGGLILAGKSMPAGSLRNVFWSVVPPLLVAAAFLGKWLIFRLKARVTYPRAGYAEGRQPRWRVALMAWIVSLAIGLGAASLALQLSLTVGLVLSGVFVLLARWQNTPRLLWYAAAPPLLHAAHYWIRGGPLSLDWMFVMLGAACTVGGAIRLALFLRDNPTQAETGA